MSLFSKPKVILWPRDKSVEIYINRAENNRVILDLDLWRPKTLQELEPLAFFFQKNKISNCSVLIPDDIALTKSFIYDTKIDAIDKKEVIGLAESFVPFKIDSEAIEYNLIQGEDKTIIRSVIFEKSKTDNLEKNLAQINININLLRPVSDAISNVVSSIYKQEFFLIYPLNEHEYTLLLSKDNQIYLTANFKGPELDIQKTINYSNLYFSTPAKKLYYPEKSEIEIITTTELEKTAYNENQITQNIIRSYNLPLPVIGAISDIIKPLPDNSSLKNNMNNKKNILPIIAVLIFTAALVSFVLYFISTRNKNSETDNNSTEEITSIPTSTPTPTPTVAEISKDIKIQVLNATDITGQAATLKTKITALGFTSINTGNATTKATENKVQVKSASVSAYFQSSLATDFPATYTTDLAASSKYDAVFTIGTNLSTGQAATPTSDLSTTVTPTKKATATPTVAKTTVTPTSTKAPTATPTQ